MSESKPKPVRPICPANLALQIADDSQTATRKQWDKDEWAAKAKEKDAEGVEKAKAAESAMKQGTSRRCSLFCTDCRSRPADRV